MNRHAAPNFAGPAPSARSRSYCYRHTVSFEETNVVGNVYFTRHLSWQGRCRELFFRDYAPEILDELHKELPARYFERELRIFRRAARSVKVSLACPAWVTAALKRETRTIPIVFATVLAKRRAEMYDCVETC
jgi:hypothetical protein